MFAGMQFCPHCGAKGDRILQDAPPLPCPACNGDMHKVHVGATTIFECSGCQSTWLDPDTFTRLCTHREEHGAIAAIVGARKEVSPALIGRKVRYLPCPICKRIMNRENFGKRSGVIIDVCKGHGVWFEHGELPAVLAFIDDGGLARARTSMAELHREQLQRTPQEVQPIDKAQASLDAQGTPSSSFTNKLLSEALNMLFND
jgi:Zn-finger nucleic acid-binding protein